METKQLIYESHFAHVYRLALYITRNKSTAEEVTQEAFTIAFEKYHQLRDPSKVANWIKAITINTARRYYNKEKKVIPLDKEQLDYVYDHPIADPMESFVNQKDLEEEMKQAIKTLPVNFQNVIILKYYYDLEVKEIAQVTEVSEGTVKSRLFRARNKLKQAITNTQPTTGKGAK